MTESKSPNIVLILADDMGYGDFGALNHGRTQTPHLDALMAEGVCLTQHYSASCVCAPARAGLMTGRYPHRTGAISLMGFRGLDRLALREATMADLLRNAGHRTGIVGKWHLGDGDLRYHSRQRGFDEATVFSGGVSDYYSWRLDCNGVRMKADGRYLTDVITDESIAFIRRNRHVPFFLYVGYNAPHRPLQAPEEDIRPFLETGQFGEPVSILYGMIRRMDTGIGRILDALEAEELDRNTIVLFTSDNGPDLGTYGGQDQMRYNCGYRDGKYSVHEGGIRVPMLVRWPDGVEGGRACHEMIHMADWLPTLLSACGAERPENPKLDGEDILPVLRGERNDDVPKRFWQWTRYHPAMTSNAAMRDGAWKLVRPTIPAGHRMQPDDAAMSKRIQENPDMPFPVVDAPLPEIDLSNPPPPELYDVQADPLEQHDLAAEQPERVSRMLRELEAWFCEVESDRREIG